MLWFFVALAALVAVFGPWLAILVVHMRLESRIDAIAQKLRFADAQAQPDASRDQIEALGRRIAALESEAERAISQRRPEPAAPPQEPQVGRTEPSVAAAAPPEVATEVPSMPPASPQRTQAKSDAAPQEAAAARTTADIEALIGEDWLNKLGVLVLVIGLALTLGYSFTSTGPMGRVAIGLATSVGLLVAGRVFERKEAYRLYGSGLIGGGWAALYFTTYAMHGLEAARVIASPVVGFALLLAVALAMILSSLRYRSEVVTGLAFIVGFATLAVSPDSSFGILASVPLAAGLLVVAHRFAWVRLAFVGVLVAYGVYMFAPGEAPDTGSRLGDFFAGQTVLVLYWLLFEAFDLLRPVHRAPAADTSSSRSGRLTLSDAIFPLNATAFLGVSVLQWLSVDAQMLDLFLPLAALAFLGSALMRARLRPLVGDDNLDPVPSMLVGYGGAAVLAAALGVLSIFSRFSGHSVSVALLLEAQIVFLCGLYLHRRFLRGLAVAVFAVAWANVLGGLFSGFSATAWLGMQDGSLMAVSCAAVLYLNRSWLRAPRSSPTMIAERAYSFAATFLLVLVVTVEAPEHFLEMWWLGLAMGLLDVGLRAGRRDLRLQAYGVSGLAICVLMISRVFGSMVAGVIGTTDFDTGAARFAVGAGAVVVVLMATRLHRDRTGQVGARERVAARAGFVVAGTLLTMSLLWLVLPVPAVVLAWGGLALLLIETGAVVDDPPLRLLGSAVSFASLGRLFWTNLWLDGTTAGMPDSLVTALPVIALAYYLAARIVTLRRAESPAAWEKQAARAYLWGAFLALLGLVWLEVATLWVGPVWAVYLVSLMMAGRRWSSGDLRAQSYVLVLPTLGVCQLLNVTPDLGAGEVFGSAGHSVMIHAAVVGIVAFSFYLARILVRFEVWSQANAGEDPDARATNLVAVLATLLVSLTLVHEVDGSLLTVALGIQGALMMIVGFTLADRVFRLSGLVLLGACVLKAFAYDLSELDPLFRILSFVVLGFLLLGVSFIYTRYREKLQRFL